MPRPGRMVSAAAFAALILLSAGNPALLLASDSDSRLVRANQLDDEAHQLLEKDQFEAAIERMRDALVLR
ncbi:MAG TPA: hypothetical protein VFP80_01205, partial [Thermoanaerobaculia bacterium]|nr:hypothetical protein [Thermoanaerobaculia bacterium]